MSKPNAIEMPYCQWVLRVAMSDMRTAEKLVTIVAPLVQTGDTRTLSLATGLAEATIKTAKARPVRDGWLWITPVGHEHSSGKENKGGRGIKNQYRASLPDSNIPVTITDIEQVALTASVAIVHASGEKIEVETSQKGRSSETLSTENGIAPDTLSGQKGRYPDTLSAKIPHTPYKESPTEITNTTTSQPTTTVEESEDSSSEIPKPGRKKNSYSDAFETFWRTYPTTPIMSKLKAFEQWQRLGADDQALVVRGLRGFADFLRKNPDHPVVHAERYISQRRFEGFAGGEAKTGGGHWWENPSNVARVTEDQWRGSINKNANGHWPEDKLGPVPGRKDCKVPQRIIDELRLLERYGTDGLERPEWRAKHGGAH